MISLLFLSILVASAASASEYRALWVTGWSSGFLNRAEVDKLLGVPGDPASLGDVRKANCNAVFVQVRRRADVCYVSGMGEPYFSGLSPSNFDALQAIIDAAHDTTGGKQRIEVHCWVVAFATAGGAVYSQHDDPSKPDQYWMTLDNYGAETSDKAMDPGHPKCLEYLTNVSMDLVTKYDIDGINYDYIRYTAYNQGYNPTSIARYNARYGLTGQPQPNDEQFKQWRRDQVTALVRQVYARIQVTKPWVKLSCSTVTWSPAPESSTRQAFMTTPAYSTVYSDWDAWMQEGIVDLMVPMTYFSGGPTSSYYIKWCNFEKDRQAGRYIVIGPGTYLNSIQDALDQVKMTRTASDNGSYAHGFCIYCYQEPCSDGTWDSFSSQLVSQVTTSPANVPSLPCKTAPTKGHIGGAVTYAPNGDWADGATVRIVGASESRSMVCDGTGFYAFIDLTPGSYTLTVDYKTFHEIRQLSVTAASITMSDVSLTYSDPTPPVITNLNVTGVSDSSAKIAWTTDDPSTSEVDYGISSAYGQSADGGNDLVTDHSITLTGLRPGVTCYYRVKSKNGASLETTAAGSFTTDQPYSEIIVDDSYPNCTYMGTWTSTSSSDGWLGGYKYVSRTSAASAKWTPGLSRTGPYDVYVYYREGASRSTCAPYMILCSYGILTVNVNQTINGRQWYKIASGLSFNTGSANVTLSNQTNDPSSAVVIADAVKFVYVGDNSAPVMSCVTDESYTTSTTQLSATWLGADPQSSISNYEYRVGSQPGLGDIKDWTSAGSSRSVIINGLTLTVGNTYYISARAVNSAAMTSPPLSSAGVKIARSMAGIASVKSLPDGQFVCIPIASVSAIFDEAFYIEDKSRTSGIRIDSGASVVDGQSVQVYGILRTNENGERTLSGCLVKDAASNL